MSLLQTFEKAPKGDGIFRIPENPIKYEDILFQDSVNANNPNKALQNKNAIMPTSQLASINKANSSVPGN